MSITPRYVSNHSLQVGPITDLMGSKVTCVGLGNAYTRPLGYVVIWVQVDGVWGYDEDQIALGNPRLFQFCSQSPCYPWDAHCWLSSQCNERGRDGCLSDAMGEF